MNRLSLTFTEDGAQYKPEDLTVFQATRFLDYPEHFGSQAILVSYLYQLEEEGFGEFQNEAMTLPWESIYRLLSTPDHKENFSLLELPPIEPIAPNLKSSDGLTDSNFSIFIAGWRRLGGGQFTRRLSLRGALIEFGTQKAMLSEASWCLSQAVKDFAKVPAAEKTPDVNRRSWANIRELALSAQAGLDDFLLHTIVLTPKKNPTPYEQKGSGWNESGRGHP